MHLGHERSAADAIAFYNRERTRDGRGLTEAVAATICTYYERVLAGEAHSGDVRTLRAVQATNVGGNRPEGNLRLATSDSTKWDSWATNSSSTWTSRPRWASRRRRARSG